MSECVSATDCKDKMDAVWQVITGKDGLRESVTAVEKWIAVREDREARRDKAQARRDTWHNLLLAAVTAALTFFSVVQTFWRK